MTTQETLSEIIKVLNNPPNPYYQKAHLIDLLEKYAESQVKKLNKYNVSVTVCKCKKPILIATVHPLPDICDYCRKEIIQTEH